MSKTTITKQKTRFYIWHFTYCSNYCHLYDSETKLLYDREGEHSLIESGGHESVIFSFPGWVPVTDEEGLKAIIGGWHYAKSTYENKKLAY